MSERREIRQSYDDVSLRLQLSRGSLSDLVMVPTVFTIATAVAAAFGYHSVTAYGTSMEPAVRNGDALYAKHLYPSTVNAEDIVHSEDPKGGG